MLLHPAAPSLLRACCVSHVAVNDLDMYGSNSSWCALNSNCDKAFGNVARPACILMPSLLALILLASPTSLPLTPAPLPYLLPSFRCSSRAGGATVRVLQRRPYQPPPPPQTPLIRQLRHLIPLPPPSPPLQLQRKSLSRYTLPPPPSPSSLQISCTQSRRRMLQRVSGLQCGSVQAIPCSWCECVLEVARKSAIRSVCDMCPRRAKRAGSKDTQK
jgi:hypothetical protein